MHDEEASSVQELLARDISLRRVDAGEYALFDLYDLAATAEGEFGAVLDAEASNSGEEVGELRRRPRVRDRCAGGRRRGRARVRATRAAARYRVDVGIGGRFLPAARLIAWHLAPTLSIHLAVRGLPPVRGPEQEALAAEGRWCDSGRPEGLAEKISFFERIASESGRRVPEPRSRAAFQARRERVRSVG